MRLGIHLPHIGQKAGPDAIRDAAIQAEALGFADVWVSEHIIVPKDRAYPPSAIFWDPVLTLTWAAAVTRRVGLGTSVLVLPMRLTERLGSRAPASLLDVALLHSAVAWERAAVLAGHTMTEWALLSLVGRGA